MAAYRALRPRRSGLEDLLICISSLPAQQREGMGRGAYRRRRRAARKGRASLQGTMPCRTPFATMRTGVSCISANATAICIPVYTQP